MTAAAAAVEVDACSRLRSAPPAPHRDPTLRSSGGSIAMPIKSSRAQSTPVDVPDFYVCGWRLRTGLTLPFALPWPRAQRGSPDLVFAAHTAPRSLKNPKLDLEVLQIDARGTALVRFHGIGRFLIHK